MVNGAAAVRAIGVPDRPGFPIDQLGSGAVARKVESVVRAGNACLGIVAIYPQVAGTRVEVQLEGLAWASDLHFRDVGAIVCVGGCGDHATGPVVIRRLGTGASVLGIQPKNGSLQVGLGIGVITDGHAHGVTLWLGRQSHG